MINTNTKNTNNDVTYIRLNKTVNKDKKQPAEQTEIQSMIAKQIKPTTTTNRKTNKRPT